MTRRSLFALPFVPFFRKWFPKKQPSFSLTVSGGTLTFPRLSEAEVRDRILPEITKELETGIGRTREQWVKLLKLDPKVTEYVDAVSSRHLEQEMHARLHGNWDGYLEKLTARIMNDFKH